MRKALQHLAWWLAPHGARSKRRKLQQHPTALTKLTSGEWQKTWIGMTSGGLGNCLVSWIAQEAGALSSKGFKSALYHGTLLPSALHGERPFQRHTRIQSDTMPRKRAREEDWPALYAQLRRNVCYDNGRGAPLGMESAFGQLHRLFSSLVLSGENCSTLVVGRR